MDINSLKKVVSGAAVTLGLAIAVLLGASGTAQAQHSDRDHHDNYGGYGSRGGYGSYGGGVSRMAYDNGYNSGVRHGQDHARQRHRYDPTDPSEYRSGTQGYHSEYGSKEDYKQSFREGFRRGYDAGYRQYGGYGNDPYSRQGGYGRDPYGRNDPYSRSDRYDPYYDQGRGGYGPGHRRGRFRLPWPF